MVVIIPIFKRATLKNIYQKMITPIISTFIYPAGDNYIIKDRRSKRSGDLTLGNFPSVSDISLLKEKVVHIVTAPDLCVCKSDLLGNDGVDFIPPFPEKDTIKKELLCERFNCIFYGNKNRLASLTAALESFQATPCIIEPFWAYIGRVFNKDNDESFFAYVHGDGNIYYCAMYKHIPILSLVSSPGNDTWAIRGLTQGLGSNRLNNYCSKIFVLGTTDKERLELPDDWEQVFISYPDEVFQI